MFDGHVSSMSAPPLERVLRLGLATLLAGANAAFWLMAFESGYPVPLAAYADPSPAITRTPDGGMRFDMCSHCGRGFWLAGREPWSPIWLQDSPWVRAAWLTNIPGRLLSKGAGTLTEDAIGQYGAMWTETAVFTIASTAQWVLLGWWAGGLSSRLVFFRSRAHRV